MEERRLGATLTPPRSRSAQVVALEGKDIGAADGAPASNLCFLISCPPVHLTVCAKDLKVRASPLPSRPPSHPSLPSLPPSHQPCLPPGLAVARTRHPRAVPPLERSLGSTRTAACLRLTAACRRLADARLLAQRAAGAGSQVEGEARPGGGGRQPEAWPVGGIAIATAAPWGRWRPDPGAFSG